MTWREIQKKKFKLDLTNIFFGWHGRAGHFCPLDIFGQAKAILDTFLSYPIIQYEFEHELWW